MLRTSVPTGHDIVPDSLTFHASANEVWAVTPVGEIVAVRLLDRRVRTVGTGYVDPVAAVPLADSLRLVVVEADGTVLVAHRDLADRASAGMLTSVPGGAVAAASDHSSEAVLIICAGSVDGDPGPQLVSCSASDGSLTVLASGLTGAKAMTVDPEQRRAVVLATVPGDPGELIVVDLDGGGVVDRIGGLPAYEHLVIAPDPGEPGVITEDGNAPGDLVVVEPNGDEGTRQNLPDPVEGLTRWGSLIIACSGQDLVVVEWGVGRGKVRIGSPLGPLYVNGYARLHVDLPGAGLNPGEVSYAVREGFEAGQVSAGTEPPDPDGTETVMLLAGTRTGEFHLDATLTADGSLLTTRRFRVTRLWPDDEVGPPVATTGNQQSYLMSWGGPGGGESYLHPAPPFWRVLVVLVHLKGRDWGGLEVGARTEWKDRVVGATGSVKEFYEEVSAYVPGSHGTTIDLVDDTVHGPVFVDAGWADVFEARDMADVNSGWTTKPTGYPVLAGAISDYFMDRPDGAQTMSRADSIAIVVRNGTDAPIDLRPMIPLQIPTFYIWGHANHTEFNWKTATTFTQEKLPVMVMPNVLPAGVTFENQAFTMAHEIGHNLGLADLYDAHDDYPAEINARRPAGVDLMSTDDDLPHFSIANRVRLGWIDRAWLRRFDFSASPTGGSVTLQATETIAATGPRPGHVAGIEVPIEKDWSYFFEYRREQAGQMGDQNLDTSVVSGRTQIVVGTDLRHRGGQVARPPIILLGQDPDADGPLLVNAGQDYRDSDTTNPERMHDFTLEVTSIGAPDPDTAQVDVTYVEAHRPQLQVRPAKGVDDFKSEDIDARGPFGLSDVVVKGATNTIAVTVHNLGVLPAEQAQIHVRWLPYTVTGGAWVNLPDPAPFSVAARGKTRIEIPWPIPKSVKVGDVEALHFCVRVDIDRYRDPAHPDQEEIVVHDNWAQSNFTGAAVPFGSPSARLMTAVGASNVLDRAATYTFEADQSSPWYRIFLGHAWLRLPVGGDAAVELGYESLAGDPQHGDEFDRQIELISNEVDHVAVNSYVLPEGTRCPAPRHLFGVGLDLRVGRRAWFEDVQRDGELLIMRVLSATDGVPFDVTFGELHLACWPDEAPERVTVTVGEISNGFGRVLVRGDTLSDLEQGVRTSYVLLRPGDNVFAEAVTEPAPLE